jgi:hypothetical protein
MVLVIAILLSMRWIAIRGKKRTIFWQIFAAGLREHLEIENAGGFLIAKARRCEKRGRFGAVRPITRRGLGRRSSAAWHPEFCLLSEDCVLLVLGTSYVGYMNDLAVFDRALRDEEVSQLYGLNHGVRNLR